MKSEKCHQCVYLRKIGARLASSARSCLFTCLCPLSLSFLLLILFPPFPPPFHFSTPCCTPLTLTPANRITRTGQPIRQTQHFSPTQTKKCLNSAREMSNGQPQQNQYDVDDEKLDYIESQPPSDGEDFDEGHLSDDNQSGIVDGSPDNKTTQRSHGNNNTSMASSIAESYHGRFPFYHNNKASIHHLITFLICTGLFIPAVVIHKEGNILVLSLLYAAIVWWLLVQHLPKGTITRPVAAVWNGGAYMLSRLPEKLVMAFGYGIPPLALILTAALRPSDSQGTRGQRLTSCLGLVVLLGITILSSKVTVPLCSNPIDRPGRFRTNSPYYFYFEVAQKKTIINTFSQKLYIRLL